MQPKNNLHILIAEDDFLVSETIQNELQDLGYAVAGKASDGRQAVEMTQLLQPDVVVMDIMMPEMNGLEATHNIFKTCPTPVVMLTAYDSPDLVEQAGKAGAGAYLVKMPSTREIERAITIALARFDDMVELRRLNAALQSRNKELHKALGKIKTLEGILPLCTECKKIRNEEDQWEKIDVYIKKHSPADISHTICPECMKKNYPEEYKALFE